MPWYVESTLAHQRGYPVLLSRGMDGSSGQPMRARNSPGINSPGVMWVGGEVKPRKGSLARALRARRAHSNEACLAWRACSLVSRSAALASAAVHQSQTTTLWTPLAMPSFPAATSINQSTPSSNVSTNHSTPTMGMRVEPAMRFSTTYPKPTTQSSGLASVRPLSA